MSNASDFIIENGVLKKYVGPGGDVVIPAEVERIGSMAFYDHKTLTSIIIPDHVKELGERVFKGCTHLQTVTIPDTAKIIGKPSLLGHLFSGCVALEAVNTSPEKKAEIYRLIDVENLFTQKKQSHFPEDREEYTRALMMDMLRHFDNPVKNKKAFLTAVINADDGEALQILLEKKYISTTKIRDELIEVAASGQKAAAVAVLLEYKERTGDRNKEEAVKRKKEEQMLSAPPDTKKLWNLYLYNKNQRKRDQFYGISGYKGNETTIEVPSFIDKIPVLHIESKAFASYKRSSQSRADTLNAITEIILPDTIQHIGAEAFHGCESLKHIAIPENVTKIADGAFMRCPSLEEVHIPDHTSLGKMAFKYCNSLKKFSLPKSRSAIETSDFAHCISLTDVVIPEHIAEIESWAFHGCVNLQSVMIHAGVTKIHKTAFAECQALTIHAPAGSYAETYATENNILFVAD